MCRYRYRGSHCANAAIATRECTGEERCHVRSGQRGSLGAQPECTKEQWSGLYCAKYQRFFCSGSGKCSTAAEYLESLHDPRSGPWRP
jgi:hypothetical protein